MGPLISERRRDTSTARSGPVPRIADGDDWPDMGRRHTIPVAEKGNDEEIDLMCGPSAVYQVVHKLKDVDELNPPG